MTYSGPPRDLSLTNLSVQKNLIAQKITSAVGDITHLTATQVNATQVTATQVDARIIYMPYAMISLPIMAATYTLLYEAVPGASDGFGITYPDGDSGQGFPVFAMAQSVGADIVPLYVSTSASWTTWVPASPIPKRVRLATNYVFTNDPDYVMNVDINGTILTINASNAVGNDPTTAPYQCLYETESFDWPVNDVMNITVYVSGEGPNGAYIQLFDHVIIM